MSINDILRSVVPSILLAACATGGSAERAWHPDDQPDDSAAVAWPNEHPDEPGPASEGLQLPQAASAATAWPNEHPDEPGPAPDSAL